MELPKLLFGTSDASEQAKMRRLRKLGLIHRIGPRLYTSAPKGSERELVLKNWSLIVSTLFPNALLSHRSALEYKPSPHHTVYLTANTDRQLHFPGLTLRFMKGPLPLKDDPHFLDMRVSSVARALLENLSVARSGEDEPKTVDLSYLEEFLEQRLRSFF